MNFSIPVPINSFQREFIVKVILVLFCATFWFGSLYKYTVPLLLLAWLIDDGVVKFKSLIKEPLVQAILILCAVLLIGTLWSEAPLAGRKKWIKYFLLLLYLPFLSLLNRDRLLYAIGGLLAGYGLILSIGVYQWIANEEQGIPALDMSYLRFSAILGVAAIFSVYFVCYSRNCVVQISLLVFGLILLFLQFQQNARGFLLATLLTLLVLIWNHFWTNMRRFAALLLALIIFVGVFAYTSPVIQDRWVQAQQDFVKLQQADYSSSIGYRLAMWDVGLHGILQQPCWGHGTGSPEHYFNQTITNYKGGVYKDLLDFHPYAHYHNDWIEIGMHVGLLGIFALMYLFWAWYVTFKRCGMVLLGTSVVCFILLSGLTEVFMIFYRIPVLLLIITGITVVYCQKENNLNVEGTLHA
ncbi:MAG: O-antigen ligase family protein [Nitrosomonas sp.]